VESKLKSAYSFRYPCNSSGICAKPFQNLAGYPHAGTVEIYKCENESHAEEDSANQSADVAAFIRGQFLYGAVNNQGNHQKQDNSE
jgi:hypothetical protein